jgi:eukaryotic translation initiation factor 2-alpha kinase 4
MLSRLIHCDADFYCSVVAGHPKTTKAAALDIISPDRNTGPTAAATELLAIVNECLIRFPNLSSNYEIHISHSSSSLSL